MKSVSSLVRCKICNKTLHGRGLPYHISKLHHISSEKYFLKYIGNKCTCKVCKKPTKYLGPLRGYRKFCSISCQSKYSMLHNWKNSKYRHAMVQSMSNKNIRKIKITSAMRIGYKKSRKTMQKLCKNPEYRKRISKKISKALKWAWKNPEYRKAKVRAMLEIWKKSGYKNNMIYQSRRMLKNSPNNFEKRIIQIINLNQLPYKFVGNGKFILAGKNPDFVHTKEKIVAEAYEDYWKSKKGMTPERYVRERRNLFAQHGYQTIFIHIKDSPDLVLKKLLVV